MKVLGLAGAAALVLAATAAAEDPARIQIQSGDLSVTIKDADRPILEYVHGPELFKPYVKQLFTPGGVNVLLDSPPDHTHHHGLMFAVGIDGVDFGGREGRGRTPKGRPLRRIVAAMRRDDGPQRPGRNARLDWP